MGTISRLCAGFSDFFFNRSYAVRSQTNQTDGPINRVYVDFVYGICADTREKPVMPLMNRIRDNTA